MTPSKSPESYVPAFGVLYGIASRGTKIVTSVHPLQVVDEAIPMTEHDIPLDAIVTPEEVIETESRFPRPKKIYWHMLEPEKIDDIPALRLGSD